MAACVAVACALFIGCSRSDHTPPADVAGVSPDGTMEMQYETDSEGRVVRVKGFQPFIDRVMAGAPPALRDSFGAMYSEGYFKQLCDTARMAPNRGVKPGDRWQRSIREEMGSLGTLAVYAQMKFKEWEQHGDRKCARIESIGKLSSEPPPTQGEAQTVAMEIEEGTVNSTGWFDPALGMVVESVANQNLTMKITTQGRTVSSRMDQKINFKLRDVVAMAD